jgi:hypothetical protein
MRTGDTDFTDKNSVFKQNAAFIGFNDKEKTPVSTFQTSNKQNSLSAFAD